MCIKHLWPFCIRCEKVKNDSIHSCDDSSRKRRSSVAPEDSNGNSKENSTIPIFTERSLIEGKWVQLSAKNFASLLSALSITNTDLAVTKTLHLDPVIMTCRSLDNNGEVWEFMYESVQRGIIKNIMKVGEECDELTPHRQWVRITVTMPNKNTMNGVRKYKNGTQAHLILEVKPTDPDQIFSTICCDEVVTVFTGTRIKEVNN